MDAPDDENDVKLHRASADLLSDISSRIDELLTATSMAEEPLDQPIWVPDSQIEKLNSLLDRFQEWPQLLDPQLAQLVNPLLQTFLLYLVSRIHDDQNQFQAPHPGLSPLPSAICCILDTLCKVRGVKVITRFLDNEPRYLEPMLRGFLLKQLDMTWQERYVMLLWLSHLVLTPFDLQSISHPGEELFKQARLPKEWGHRNIPVIAIALINAGLDNLGVPSKERESAARLVVRLALRPDMQRLRLLHDLVKLMFIKLLEYTQRPAASMYECLGYLSVLSGISKSGSADDVLPVLSGIFDFGLKAATAEPVEFSTMRTSAPARKLLVSILRTSTLHAISLNAREGAKHVSDNALYSMLEGLIQYYLDALGDGDTSVRLAAGKALSMLAQKLDEGMKAEVFQAILDALEKDVLYEKSNSRDTISVKLLADKDIQAMSRNLAAVNPLKWQGLLFTLGHMIFRRTAPAEQLPRFLTALLSALDFEQRSAVGTSIGGSVRDAACFGLWSLARKYATLELQCVEHASVLPVLEATFSTTYETSILQIVADQLVVSACLDPSGNIRRGSSAALQELIGRHPDTIIQGIALVQIVDYHAVARRSRAMLDIAAGAAELGHVYRWALLNALFRWRGIRAVDDNSRRTAAAAISKLISMGSFQDYLTALDTAQKQLSRLPVQNSKTVVQIRHGLLITVTHMLDAMTTTAIAKLKSRTSLQVENLLQLLWEGIRLDGPMLGNLKKRFTSELMLEGAAWLLSSLVRRIPRGYLESSQLVIEVLDVCLIQADHDVALSACTNAAFELLSRLPDPQKVDVVEIWLDSKRQQHSSFSCKGRILAMGTVYAALPESLAVDHMRLGKTCRSRVFAQLTGFIQGDWPIETQVTALRSLISTIPHLNEEDIEGPLCAGLDNYTNDQRGDVGSWARLEAVKAVSILLLKVKKTPNAKSNHQPLLQRLFRLAGEKLDKLRFEAWKCIEIFLTVMQIQPVEKFSHVVDVSSNQYYFTLSQFLQVSSLRSCIVQGIVHSLTSGTESLMRASRFAIVRSITSNSTDSQTRRLLHVLVTLLEDLYTDDRQVTPLLETLAFVLEQHIELDVDIDCMLPSRKIWNVVRKAHFKSTNIRKLEAAVKIYGALAVHGDMRENALDKLRDLLLHPYPDVRNAAADALYAQIPDEMLLVQDWSRPPTELKGVVIKLKEVSEVSAVA